MSTYFDRREFLLRESSIAAAGSLSDAAARRGVAADRIKRAACMAVLTEATTVLERFELAKIGGCEGVEPTTLNTADEVRQHREAAEKTGLKIHSIMNSDHWRYSL